MAIIYSYPTINPVKSNDTIILTRCDSSTNLESKNYSASLSTLKTYINGGTISYGTGTTNYLPIWEDGPGGVLGDSIVYGEDNKIGIRTSTPESALDVNGTVRIRKQLNVGSTTSQNLFVGGDEDEWSRYVKMGDYGSGNYWNEASNPGGYSANAVPQYLQAFGSEGKIVEKYRFYNFKITGSVLKNIGTTPQVLIECDTSSPENERVTYVLHEAQLYALSYSDVSPTLAATWPTGCGLQISYYQTGVGFPRVACKWTDEQLNDNKIKRRLLFPDRGVIHDTSVIPYNAVSQIGQQGMVPFKGLRLETSDGSDPSGADSFFDNINWWLRIKVEKIRFSNDVLNNPQTITLPI